MASTKTGRGMLSFLRSCGSVHSTEENCNEGDAEHIHQQTAEQMIAWCCQRALIVGEASAVANCVVISTPFLSTAASTGAGAICISTTVNLSNVDSGLLALTGQLSTDFACQRDAGRSCCTVLTPDAPEHYTRYKIQQLSQRMLI
eukprot:COSAG02_NODE_1382_length_12967_cov_9.151694_9_plen_145_part_00